MQTFSMFFSEDAGDKFSKMSDDQFESWKKNNPGAAQKADELRKKAQGSSAPKPNKYEQAKKALPGDKGSALAKTRKSEMGKWSQGIKNAAKNKVKDAVKDAAKKKAAEFMTSPDDQNTSTAQSRRRKREEKRNRELEDIKFERGQKLKKRAGQAKNVAGAVARFIQNKMKDTVKGGDGPAFGSDLRGAQSR